MRTLVAIAYYGTINEPHLRRLLHEYDAMPFDVDVVVLTEREKELPPHVEQLVGTPSCDPHSLPFAHKRLFATRRDAYDLFIYSEDDTLVTEADIRGFLWASDVLPPHAIAGFLREERHPDGTRHCSTVHNHFHWDPTSAIRVGDDVFGHFTNPHGACYMLRRDHLELAIASGGFLGPPRSGRFDMRVTAATDPYTSCGMTKVICLTRLQEFLLPHLSNRYVERLGIPLDHLRVQVDALVRTLDGATPTTRLLQPTKPLSDPRWDKRFYELDCPDVLAALPLDHRRVLCFGTTSGDLEAALLERGHEVVGIPVDGVIGALASTRGVRVVAPDLDAALGELADDSFDALLAHNSLHHLADPVAALRRLRPLLRAGGLALVTAPNVERERLRSALRRDRPPVPSGPFEQVGAHLVPAGALAGWLRSAGFAGVGGLGRPDPRARLTRPVHTVCGRAAPTPHRRRRPPGRAPLVSVGLPVHNGGKHLEECLTSLCGQNLEDLEIVISDNASTDDTQEICRHFAADDRRISYVRQETNRGAAHNYNETFLRSRGEFFTWAAHDDVRHPAHLSACLEPFDGGRSNVVLVHPRAYFIDEWGQPLHPDDDDVATTGRTPQRRLGHVLAHVNMANAVFGLIRAGALEQTRLIGGFVASDYVLLAELAMLGRIVQVPEVLLHRRLHAGSSRQANRTDEEVTAWFDADAGRPRLSTRKRLALEYCWSAARLPMSLAEHVACVVTAPAVMAGRSTRNAGGRWKRQLQGGAPMQAHR